MIPNCKAHLAPLLVDPLVLHVFPVAVAQSCVVSQGQDPGSLQTLGQGVAVVAGQTVDDARVACNVRGNYSMIIKLFICLNRFKTDF